MKSFIAFIGALCAAFMFSAVSASADGGSSVNLAGLAAQAEASVVKDAGPDKQVVQTNCYSCSSVAVKGAVTETVGAYLCRVKTTTNGVVKNNVLAATYVEVYNSTTKSQTHEEVALAPKVVKAKDQSFTVKAGPSCKAIDAAENYKFSGASETNWKNGAYSHYNQNGLHSAATSEGFEHELDGPTIESFDRFHSESKNKS